MNIFENELVRKYFGCGDSGHPIYHQCNEARTLALAIVTAMQQPIRKGDKLLRIVHVNRIEEYTAKCDAENGFEHGSIVCLRLPDRFQEKKECAACKIAPFTIEDLCEKHQPEIRAYMAEIPKPQPEADWPCIACSGDRRCDHVPRPADPVEEKIEWVVMNWSNKDDLIQHLRDLVALVRRTK